VDLLWFLHKNGEKMTKIECRKLLCMGKIYLNATPITLKQGMDYKLKENDIISIGEYQGKVWIV